MASSWRQCPPRGPFHATRQREDDTTATTTSPFPSLSRATSAAAAEGRDDASRPPPPAPAYEFSEEAAPSRSGGTEESSSAAPLLPLAPRTRASFTSNFAGASTARSSPDFKKASATLPSSASSSGAPGFSLARSRSGARKGVPKAGAQEGERSNSAASRVNGNGFERAATIPAPDAVASRPGTSGSTAHSRGALSSLAGGGQPSFSIAPRSPSSSPWMQDKQMSVSLSKNDAARRFRDCSELDMIANSKGDKRWEDSNLSVSVGGYPTSSALIRFRDCSEDSHVSVSVGSYPTSALPRFKDCPEDRQLSVSMGSYPTSSLPRDLTAPEAGEFFVSDPKEVDSCSNGYPRYALGSKYWDQYPASEELNPPGFFSPHPLWEGFAIPAKVGEKSAFHCVFCGEKFLGSADKGVKHMLRNQGCQIPDLESKILVKNLDAYRKKKQDLVKRKRQDK